MFVGALIFAIYVIQCFQYLDGALNFKVYAVSWNVADNEKMKGELPNAMVAALLDRKHNAEIFAISLQENCFQCNKKKMFRISDIFRRELKRRYNMIYELKGMQMTRYSTACETGCTVGLHGTTLMMVFTRTEQVVKESERTILFGVNNCLESEKSNDEKGIAAVKITLIDGKKVCFAGAHLDSTSPQSRRNCIRRFFTETNEWRDCHRFYLMGDFNARTGRDGEARRTSGVILTNEKLRQLIVKDEMNGEEPYGNTSLLNSISALSGWKFEEPLKPIIDVQTFIPTYSVLESEKYCDGRKPCYREERSPAWTDRIVCHNCGEVVIKYTSEIAFSEYSDHLPVIGIYQFEEAITKF